MLTIHRKQRILALLKQHGQVVAKNVSNAMGVSEDTIRRDLREMAREGRRVGLEHADHRRLVVGHTRSCHHR